MAQFKVQHPEPEKTAIPFFRSDLPLVEPPTDRDHEVFELITACLTSQQISEEHITALGTVKAHTSSIYGKLDVRSRTQAVARARELKLLN